MVMVGEGYRVKAMDGRVECPVCHAIIDSEDYDSYDLSFHKNLSASTLKLYL